MRELPADVAEREGGADAAAADAGAPAPVPSAAGSSESRPAADEPLTLAAAISAAAAERDGAAERAPDAGAAQAADALCTSVGPFRELAQAATAAANLRAAGYEPTQRVAEGDIWIGYWVYIDAITTESDANEILAKVRANGIADSYVIPNSDSGNLVSLGVFSEISGVSQAARQGARARLRAESRRSHAARDRVLGRRRAQGRAGARLRRAADARAASFASSSAPARRRRHRS